MPTRPRPTTKPKHTDAERHARFVQTARDVEVDESPEAFDRAFDRLKIKTPPDDQASSGPGSER